MSEADRNRPGFRAPNSIDTVEGIRLDVIVRLRDHGIPINKAFNFAREIADYAESVIEHYPMKW